MGKKIDFEGFFDEALFSGDYDGFEIESLAIKYGIIEEKRMAYPCGENCRCREYYSEEDFPVICFRKTYKR